MKNSRLIDGCLADSIPAMGGGIGDDGPRQEAQASLFYEFSLENHVPKDHLLLSIDRFIDLTGIRAYLADFYSHTGCPSVDPELLIRMLLVGYCFGIRSSQRFGRQFDRSGFSSLAKGISRASVFIDRQCPVSLGYAMKSGEFLDDLSVGDTFETGGITLTEGGIVDFALMHDPQPFHVDKVAAAESIFGGLIASGFQTIALTFRMFRDTGVLTGTNLGGHGMDEVRWHAPMYSGDTIRARVTVESVTPSRSKPDRGTVRFRYRSYNQNEVEVLSLTMDHVMARRKADRSL